MVLVRLRKHRFGDNLSQGGIRLLSRFPFLPQHPNGLALDVLVPHSLRLRTIPSGDLGTSPFIHIRSFEYTRLHERRAAAV